MLRRVFVVYNPESSHADRVRREVLDEVRGLSGWMVAKFEVRGSSFTENVDRLAMLLGDGDLVITAGGDGTAAIAANGVLKSGKDVVLGALAYGNFNDIATALGANRKSKVGEIVEKYGQGEVERLFPLRVKVDDVVWRYAPCYVTLGMLAEATQIFDEPKVRESLKTHEHGVWFSLAKAVKWYLRNRKRDFLPAAAEGGRGVNKNGDALPMKTTDYLAMNGPRMAKIMKSADCGRKERKFKSSTQRLGGFGGMVAFGLKSVGAGVTSEDTEGDLIEFASASTVGIQAEGEYERLINVRKIEICKCEEYLKVVRL